MTHNHPVVDQDKFFLVDEATRIIKPGSEERIRIMQYDHNSEIFTFELPRYIEGHDMSLCNIMQVHYTNIQRKTKSEKKGVYEIRNAKINENVIRCEWLISRNATTYEGRLNFALRFACTNGEELVYEWRTDVYKDVEVAASINNGEPIVEEYADILEEWKEELINASKHPYVSIKRQGSYLYEITFKSIPEFNSEDFQFSGGCSSYVQNGKLYRNLDWNYSELASFNVKCPGFEGMAFSSGLTDENLDDETLSQLPYRLVDGCNDYGIRVCTHVLFNDWDWVGGGNTPLYKIPYIVLSRVKSIEDLEACLSDVLDDLYATPSLVSEDYLLQFLVTDGETTYAILPPLGSTGAYVIQDITSNPKLSNFRWVSSETVSREDLQTRPTGVERWNMMPCGLSDLRFTKAYESPTRLSEFIGLRETTKYSSDDELEAIYEIAHSLYEDRERDGSTWQTVHSVVYGVQGIQELYVQENWDKNYTPQITDKEIERIIQTVIDRIENRYYSVEALDDGENAQILNITNLGGD